MLLERKDGAGKKKKGRIVIGYDLGDTHAQISYYFLHRDAQRADDMSGGEDSRKDALQKEASKKDSSRRGAPDGDVETLAVVAGTEQYNIPAVLCRKKEVKQWLFGREAVKFAEEGECFLIKNLVSLARAGEWVEAGEERFDPVALLTLFIKRSLSLLTLIASPDYLEGVMFTIDRLDGRMVEILSQVGANLQLKTDQVYFQSHVESYYYYMLHQPKELWMQEVLLCDYDDKRLKIYGFGVNNRTTPKVALIDINEYEGMERGEPAAEKTEMEEMEKSRLDRTFLEIVQNRCSASSVSCVYLIGDGYKDGWASESLRYLCRGRRVFQGNNLYSKGACYGIREKLGIEPIGEEYVFLGLDKLKANIGMRVLRRGEESYFALMDAGVNWFETKKEFHVILEDGDALSLLLTPLDGQEPKQVDMILEGIEKRPRWTTRLEIKTEMLSERELSVRVKDLGFGSFFPASGGEWNKVFEI